jgi:hypothetical protein
MIRYTFSFDSGQETIFEIYFDQPQSFALDTPEWTRLEVHQCPHCPLDRAKHSHCPAALECLPVIEKFQHTPSFKRAKVTVETPYRTYVKTVDAQTGIMAIVGLLMAKSECPYLKRLKGLAQFHLPFSSTEETLFRTVGAYFLRQYFKQKKGLEAPMDLSELAKNYEDLNTLNYHFLQRIRLASEEDANLNALVVLSNLSSVVGLSLEEQLDILQAQFSE